MNHTAKEILIKTVEKIEGAYAPSTIRAYRSNFEAFIKYCHENNVIAFPAQPENVAQYIKNLSCGRLKSSSIKIAVASIAAIHNLNSIHDPTEHPDVKIEMRRMYRTLGRYAKQAYGINRDLLKKMVTATDNSLRGIRDKTILLVAYDGLCRRSELISLKFEDVLIDKKNEGVKLKLQKSKTDPHGMGKWLYLSLETQIAIKNWLEASGIRSGKLLRGISVNGKISDNLTSSQIGRIYKKIARTLKIDPDTIRMISSHSIRIGAAQDLLQTGKSFPEIMNRGRWSKIDTVMRYAENTQY